MTAFRMAVVVLCFALASPVRAEVFRGDPANYTGLASHSLQPGDTLELAAGTYNDLLNVSGLHGTPDAWITIRGPTTGDPAIFEADPGPCCNTIEVSDSSYVAFENLTIDGQTTAVRSPSTPATAFTTSGSRTAGSSRTAAVNSRSASRITAAPPGAGSSAATGSSEPAPASTWGTPTAPIPSSESHREKPDHGFDRLLHADQAPERPQRRRRHADRPPDDHHPQQRLHQE